MFNSAIVFDERFCLDCGSQGRASVENLAHMHIPVKESRLEQQVSKPESGHRASRGKEKAAPFFSVSLNETGL